MTDDPELALALADEADALTMRHFRTSFTVRTKADRTPVTEVDEGVERLLSERLARARPDDAIAGEEFGTRGGAGRRWILDPIDATQHSIRAIPTFPPAIAFIVEGAAGSFPTVAGEARADGGSAVSTNGHVHEKVLEAMA